MRLKNGDTIVALASALPGALRALVRLSGDRSGPIARSVSLPPGSRLQILDAPRTYTLQEMAEIEVPASPPLVASILDACVASGARTAEPGEFTFRAYVNGRIDLAQAESVLSVIQAQSDSELASALHGLDGEFSRLVRSIEEDILDLAADVEASIDFSDHDVDLVDSARLRAKVDAAIVRLDRLVACTHTQTTAHDPWTVLLYGPANAGKSTLFNRLVPGADAVVSPIAGTTRDVVYGETRWEGLDAPVRIADSAGVLENPGPLDGRALLMTHEHLKSADLILLVVDATRSEAAQPLERRLDSRPYLRVENKADLAPASRGLSVSAKTGEGMDALRAAVSDALLRRTRGGPGARFAASTRQSAALNAAAYLLRQARDAGAWGAEYAAVDLREAAQELGRVTGSHVTDEILSRIFSRFCIGK